MTTSNGPSAKQRQGQRAFLSGEAAEQAVARQYVGRGYEIIARRWRGTGGEIDLVLCLGAQLVFVEVKKSHSHAQAAAQLSRGQRQRIYATAEEYLAAHADEGQSDCRFDVALLDAQGQVEILENAFGLD